MQRKKVLELPLLNQWLWGFGSLGYALFERILITYAVFYYLPPREMQVADLVTDEIFLGVFTVIGIALLLGRFVDGITDPFIATLSDRTKSRLGRRKPFMLISAIPLTVLTILMFFPPQPDGPSYLNGIWVCVIWMLFYVFFTVFINPYFALISELGHSNSLRINLGTMHALFAIIAMVAVIVIFPQVVTSLQNSGMEIRQSYQYAAVIFSLVAFLSILIASVSFNEKKHCVPATPPTTGMWKSMKSILSIKAFRVFLIGELFFQFAIFMLSLGMLYYVVVLLRQEESFLTVIGGLTIAVAIVSFPFINKISKRIGKKKPLLFGVIIMIVASFLLFGLSWNINETTLTIGVIMFGVGGLSLSTCTILTIPTYADMAREETLRTGEQREAMYYAARNLPLKITIALAGATFSYLISAFGKDIANPLGLQLSLLVIAVCSLVSFFFFAAYPEKQIQQKLSVYEDDHPVLKGV